MKRYITKRYVAVCWAEAVRLAKIDDTLLSDIRHHPNVDLLHQTDWWAWWSDEYLTTAIGLPEEHRPENLSEAAVDLIYDVWESFAREPQCGWRRLATIKRVVACEMIFAANEHEDIFFLMCEKLTVKFEEGTQGFLYRYRYCQGKQYICDITTESPKA